MVPITASTKIYNTGPCNVFQSADEESQIPYWIFQSAYNLIMRKFIPMQMQNQVIRHVHNYDSVRETKNRKQNRSYHTLSNCRSLCNSGVMVGAGMSNLNNIRNSIILYFVTVFPSQPKTQST